MLDFLDLVDAVKPQSRLSHGGLLESLRPHDLYLLVGLWDDERSLRGLAGSSSVLSTSVQGFSCLLDLEDDTCLPDAVSLGTNLSSNITWSTS